MSKNTLFRNACCRPNVFSNIYLLYRATRMCVAEIRLQVIGLMIATALPIGVAHGQTIPDVTGTYKGTGTLTLNGCTDPGDNGQYGPFEVTVILGPQSGSGFIGSSTAKAVIQGALVEEEATITAGTVTSAGSLSGSFESTMTINGFFDSSGIGTFTGSLVGDTITVTTEFQDTVGDTCFGKGSYTATRPTSTSPDLITIGLAVSATSLTTGQNFTISATVKNQGTGSSGSTTLRYFRSSDATISTADTELGTDPVPGLASGAVSDQSLLTQAPATPGAFFVGACVDAVSGESNTANNCSAGIRIDVIEKVPDLLVTPIGVSKLKLTTGESFTINASVKNQGIDSSGSTTLRYLRSTDSTISLVDTELGTDAVPGLAPGAVSDQSLTLKAPATSGIYFVGACVDGVSGESNTGNNCSIGVEIEVIDPVSDLIILAQVEVSSSKLLTGKSFTISASVKNEGPQSSGSTTLRYFLSSDSTISLADTELGTDPVPSLAAGAVSDQNLDTQAPGTPGIFFVGVCVDAVSGESNTANNCSAGIRLEVADSANLVIPLINALLLEEDTSK